MTLLAPLWLLANLALALPIALHLISRGRARRVRVASIRLLAAGDSRRLRRLRPTQLALMALRCAILAALALALAGPRWPGAATKAGPDWVLVSPALLERRASIEPTAPEAYADLDRRVADGAEVHLLAPGLPTPGDRAAAPGDDAPDDPWSLLGEADLVAPPGAVFDVLVADRLASLRGTRPSLARPVRWVAVPPVGRNRWIERGGRDAGALVAVVADSDRRRTTFARESPAVGEAEDAVVRVDGATLRLPGDDELAEDDAASLRRAAALVAAVFHAPERAEDAAYVRAALGAAAELALTPADLRGGDPDEALAPVTDGPPPDLVFWLAAAPVPDALFDRVAAGGIVVSDGGERYESCEGTIDLPYAEDVALRRRSPPAEDAGGAVVVWADGAGRPLLDARRVGAATHYRFHGRFHPAWSDLPAHAALPAWMLDLVATAGDRASRAVSSVTERSDRRAAGDQGAPRAAAAGQRPRVPSPVPERLLWLVVALGLVAERRLAARVPR